jgi:hypothetical protein
MAIVPPFHFFELARRVRFDHAVATDHHDIALGAQKYHRDVRFSNRPFGVKHFQTIRHYSVDVAHGLVLLFGIGTSNFRGDLVAVRREARYRIAASVCCTSKNALGTEKAVQVAGPIEHVHPAAVRANMRSILVAMMKSFSCSPLIFLVCSETVALPQPKLIFG